MKKKATIIIGVFSILIGVYLLGVTYSNNIGSLDRFISNNTDALNSILENKYIVLPNVLENIRDDNGNVPAYEYYNDIESRSIKALRAFDNKIFMGLGDYDVNTGPVKILYYNTLTGKVETSGTIEDNAIEEFKIIDDKLYTIGRDGTDVYGRFHLYDESTNSWSSHVIDEGWIHLFDIEKYDNKLFVCGSIFEYTNKSPVRFSMNNGESFENVKIVYSDGEAVPPSSAYRGESLFAYNDDLYFHSICLTNVDNNPNYNCDNKIVGVYKYDKEDNQFNYLQNNIPKNYPFKSGGFYVNYQHAYKKFLHFEPLKFNEQYIYISGQYIYSLSTSETGEIEFEHIKTGNDYAVLEGVIHDDTLYLLTSVFNGDMSFGVRIYSTKDLEQYDLMYEFTTDSFPYSIEYFDNNLYVGTANADEIKDSSSVGSLYKIDLNKLRKNLNIDEENRVIDVTMGTTKYSANYEVNSEESIFKTTLSFNDNMSKEARENELLKLKNLYLLYTISNNRDTVNYEKSVSYFNDALYNYIDTSQGFSSTSEFVEDVFSSFNLHTKRFSLMVENISEINGEYQVLLTLSVTNVDDVITSDKYIVNEENSYIFIESDSDINLIKENVNSSEMIDIEVDLDNNKLLLSIEDEIIREYTIARFDNDVNILKEYVYVGNLSDNEIISQFKLVNCVASISENRLQIKYNDILLKEYKLVRFSSNKLKILNDNEIYIGTITGNDIKKNINITNAEISIYDDRIELITDNNIIKQFKLLQINFGYLNDFGSELVVPEKTPYEKFIENITISTRLDYKIFNNGSEITSGNIEEGMILKIYNKDNEEIDLFNIISEYLRFDENIKVDDENRYLSNFGFNKKVNYLFNRIYTNGNITITNKNNEIIKNGNLIGTGNKVNVAFSEKNYNYTLIINGDVNGDGILSLVDINSIANYVYNYNNDLKDVYLKAADFDENSVYNLSDIMKVANKIISVENNTEKMSSYISELYYPDDITNVNNVVYKIDTVNQLIKDIDGNIRYYGADNTYDNNGETKINELNNYVYFNCDDYSNQSSDTCETWRIIGIFDGKVKLMRQQTLGTFSWNYDKNSSLLPFQYNNNWEEASIKNLLNDSYLNNKDSEYYNYVSSKPVKVDTKFKTDKIGIKENTRSIIEEKTYNIGTIEAIETYVDSIYSVERGTKVSKPTNLTTWYGKIGLPYASDYGYAADLKNCNETLDKYNSENCKNNWIKHIISSDSTADFFMTPLSSSFAVTAATQAGNVGAIQVTEAYNIYPVLYLNSNIQISNLGDGSKNNPYRLFLN